jgi:hypothetical protein
MPGTMNLRILLQELVDFLNTMSYTDVGFFIQVLPNRSIQVELDYLVGAETLVNLDILTSQVITYGGSVTAKDRQTLDSISPWLFERMAGRAGYALQREIY